MINNKLFMTAGVIVLSWVGTFVLHSNFKSFEVGVIDSHGKIEYFPDFYVTYSYDNNFIRMEGLSMDTSVQREVKVNYGGYGRRRGFRNFQCK